MKKGTVKMNPENENVINTFDPQGRLIHSIHGNKTWTFTWSGDVCKWTMTEA